MNKMLKSNNSCVSSAMGYVEEGFTICMRGSLKQRLGFSELYLIEKHTGMVKA